MMIDPIKEEFDNGGKRKDRATNVKGDLELGKKIDNVAGSNTDGANKSSEVVPEKIDWIQWVLDHKVQVFTLLGVVILVSIIATITGSASPSKSNEMAIAVQETAEIPPSSTTITSFPTFSPTPPILARVPITTPTPIPTTLNPTIQPSEKPTKMPTINPSEKPTKMPTPSPTKMPTVSPTRRAETNPPTPMPTTSFSLLISPPQTEMPVFRPTEAPTGPCDWFLNP